MSFEFFYRAYNRLLKEYSPSPAGISDSLDLEHLISPHKLVLPNAVLDRCQAAISAFWEVSRLASYQDKIFSDQPWLKALSTKQASVLMAYDFHTTADGRASLVEINTNASSFLLSDLIYRAHGIPALKSDPRGLLKESFMTEAKAWRDKPVQFATVVDDRPAEQRMYVEFLMYHDLFQSWGWQSAIVDGDSFKSSDHRLSLSDGQTVDFVYNRLTDFYFEDPAYKDLKESYLNNQVCLSPHPKEYWLLADKERLAEMAQIGWLEEIGASEASISAIRGVLIPTYELAHFGTNESLWSQRKGLFFKPRRSHGGKAVYRGSSVSKKVFERIVSEDYLAQEFVPPQPWPVNNFDAHMENWKFDLRIYVYRDQIQLAICRSYQGQVTNFASQYGGLTAVEFKN